MNRFINEGKEAYNREIPRASGEAEQMVQIARGYATERVNKARGDVAALTPCTPNTATRPMLLRRRLYLEAMETLFGETDREHW